MDVSFQSRKLAKQFNESANLDHPYRLIFRPAEEPVPVKEDGGLDWARVTAVVIIGIEDTHE